MLRKLFGARAQRQREADLTKQREAQRILIAQVIHDDIMQFVRTTTRFEHNVYKASYKLEHACARFSARAETAVNMCADGCALVLDRLSTRAAVVRANAAARAMRAAKQLDACADVADSLAAHCVMCAAAAPVVSIAHEPAFGLDCAPHTISVQASNALDMYKLYTLYSATAASATTTVELQNTPVWFCRCQLTICPRDADGHLLEWVQPSDIVLQLSKGKDSPSLQYDAWRARNVFVVTYTISNASRRSAWSKATFQLQIGVFGTCVYEAFLEVHPPFMQELFSTAAAEM